MKSPFPYYGGKQRIASKIVKLIPQHTVYVEPFCGGAAVFFAKPWPNVSDTSHYREVLNDTNGDIVNFFRCLQSQMLREKLLDRIQLTLFSREEYQLSKSKAKTCDEVERAARFFVNISQSFASGLSRGWGISCYSRNSSATWAARIARLSDYIERMLSVSIEHDDALSVIKRWDSPQTFFYCDPPYPGTDQGHYKGYCMDDLKKLVSALDKAQGSFILSNYKQQMYIPHDWQTLELKAYCTASGKGKVGQGRDKTRSATREELGDRERIEMLWVRGPKVQPRIEIQNLYKMGKFDCYAKNIEKAIEHVQMEFNLELEG